MQWVWTKSALITESHPAVKGNVDSAAVFTHQLKIYSAHLYGPLDAGKMLRKHFKGARREKIPEPTPDYLLAGISQEVQPGLVDLPDNAVFVERLVAQRGFFIKQAKLFFTAAQVSLGLAAPGDIGEGQAILENFAPGLDYRQTFQGHRDGRGLVGIEFQFAGPVGGAG